MSDEELLENAEKQLSTSYHYPRTTEGRIARDIAVQRSIAASLLVIARNSLPVNVTQRMSAEDMEHYKPVILPKE